MKINLENKKNAINYFIWIDKTNNSICDGITENSNYFFSILYSLFIFSGMSIFLYIYMNYQKIKEMFFKKRKNDNK